MAPAKHPCIVCQKNVTTNSIACSVCNRWCHSTCSDLDPQVLKYFDAQHAATGTHSWSCTGCNIAYTKLNTRIRQLENKLVEHENALKANQEETTKNTGRLDQVEKEVTVIKQTAKKDREDTVQQATAKWSREMMERKSRETNLVVYGLPEPPASVKSGPERQRLDRETTGDLFMAMDVVVNNEDVKFAARVGKVTEAVATNPRPLRISFRDMRVREQLFTNAKNLPRTDFRDVSIVPDLTEMQRKEDKDLFKEAEKMNAEMDPELSENFFYRCIGRRGERTIVRLRKTDKNRYSGNRNQDNSRQVRTEMVRTEESEDMETDATNKRGRANESDESVLEDSPGRNPTRQPTSKKANKTRNT